MHEFEVVEKYKVWFRFRREHEPNWITIRALRFYLRGGQGINPETVADFQEFLAVCRIPPGQVQLHRGPLPSSYL